MKRFWLALALLLLIFCFSLGNAAFLGSFTASLNRKLSIAGLQAEDGNWLQAEELTQDAFRMWKSHDRYLHITLRHVDTDQIATSFGEVLELISFQKCGEYSAANSRLMAQIHLIYEAEELTPENIL